MLKVCFDVKHLYYLPQYLPVADKLAEQGVQCSYLFYHQQETSLQQICQQVIKDENLNARWVDSWDQALVHYKSERHDWIVFGNQVSDIDHIHEFSKTALMQHGIGPKSCYYDVSNNLTSVRFVEGDHRLKRLQTLFPEGNFVDTGYAKLDPALNKSTASANLERLGLDPTKQTILYAPTFYPSSIERFSKDFARDFADYNIIIKPHFFSLTKKKYHKQRRRLEHWAKQPNVYLATTGEYNLLPFMMAADLLLSDASSAIFEFAALDKPVVWCDFYQLRWSYRGVFSYRFKQRMDEDISFFEQLATRVKSYPELSLAVEQALLEPNLNSATRSQITYQLAGRTDGQSAHRIAEYLAANAT